MKFARDIVLWLCVCGFLASSCGCGAGRSYRRGRKAEKRGDVHVAYEDYCRSARRRGGNGTVAAGIRRTAAPAAAYWAAQARAAHSEGRHADAWRLWMRVLEIRPDHAEALSGVRQIEEQHSGEVADARLAWIQSGSSSLRLAEAGGRADVGDPPVARDLMEAEEGADATVVAGKAAGVEEPVLAEGGDGASDTSGVETSGAESRGAQDLSELVARAVSEARPEPGAGPADPPARARRSAPGSEELEGAGRERGDDGFLVVRTLSKRDRRYPRRAPLIGGITVRLRDTDGDEDADLYLYDGDRRIKKIRELPVGRSATFRSRSGRRYRLTILSVHHKSRTVRVGVKPA